MPELGRYATSHRSMKSALIKAFLLATFALHWTPLRADDSKRVSYAPSVATLTGTIVEEGYGDDSSPIDRGKHAWILRLDRPISVPAKPGDEINTEEKNVTEVHLSVDHVKHPIANGAFGRARFTVTGTLYHGHNSHHLRPIVMLVSDLKSAQTNAKYD